MRLLWPFGDIILNIPYSILHLSPLISATAISGAQALANSQGEVFNMNT